MSVMEWRDSRRETLVAAAASLILHILVFLCIGLAMTIPAWQPPPAPPVEEPPIELTILPMEAPKPATPLYVRTPEENAPEPPKNAPFESDKNTKSATEASPSGSTPLPSLDGRESPTLELENRNYTTGTQTPASPPPSPEVVQEQPPEPAATPAPDLPAPSQLALREAPPKPKSEQQESKRTAAVQPRPPASAGFQPETRVTRIKGNISNRGKTSVDAAATPLGRYKKNVSDAIGSRWYYYVNSQIGLLNIGTVDVRFMVASSGKVGRVKVVSNTSNESFASVSVNSIIEAEIPPIPEEVAKLLDNGQLEIDYSFTILSN
ncbi:MAG: hypothetical protein ACOYM3_07435 [Terrimicrobiaceae bacterium]